MLVVEEVEQVEQVPVEEVWVDLVEEVMVESETFPKVDHLDKMEFIVLVEEVEEPDQDHYYQQEVPVVQVS